MTEVTPAEAIFFAALERPPAERSAYLDEACGGAADLRARVERLLAAHPHVGGFLEQPERTAAPGATPGAVVDGRYKLLEPIGDGGMGAVWMAEQREPVKRLVALKFIKPGMDSRAVLARFEAERQALALMDHPNIAHVFDGGETASGRPYFVMELVRGIPVTDYCDRHHLGVRERLGLFADVCHAVQHAHQKGVIHRDLKPSNLLVTLPGPTPVVKVIDFGIAKATGRPLTDRTLFTSLTAIVGTPMYMSPEQAEMSGLDVDTRADVYALGVLLYELLTGTTPFDKERLRTAGFDEVRRIIREEEPARPSTRMSTLGPAAMTASADRGSDPKRLGQSLRGELDWIVMKALEKDRNRRYESASALAADVQRYLNDDPVLACPPSAGYRLSKMVRRNRWALATAAVVLAALTLGTGVAVWQAVVATRAERRALDAAADQKSARETAEAREAETRAVLNFVESNLLAAARPAGQAGGLGRDVTLRQAVDAALPFVRDRFTGQPVIEARLRVTLGRSFEYLGEAKSSGEQYEAARAIYARHSGPDHPDTLHCLIGLAASYTLLGRYADACKLQEQTLRLQSRALGRDHPDTLRTMHNLAHSYDNLGRYAAALPLREEVLARWTAAAGRDDPLTLDSMHGLAVTCTYLGRYADALRWHEETLGLRKAKLGPDHPDTLRSAFSTATSCMLLGRYEDAFSLHEQALAMRKAKLGPDHPETLQSMNDLAVCHGYLGRDAEAAAVHEDALNRRRSKLGPTHPDTITSMSNLAIPYTGLGRHQEALVLREEVLERRTAQLGGEHPDTLTGKHNLAVTYAALGRHADALKLHQETLTLQDNKLGHAHPGTLVTMRNVAQGLIRLGRGAEAEAVIDDFARRAAKAEVHPRLVADVLELRLRHFQGLKDAAGCRATAQLWDTFGRTDARSLYDAACGRAVTAAVIRANDPSDAGTKDADAEADLAMALLRKAVAAGFKDAAHMAQDKDLDVVRARPDFQKLMAELGSGPANEKK